MKNILIQSRKVFNPFVFILLITLLSIQSLFASSTKIDIGIFQGMMSQRIDIKIRPEFKINANDVFTNIVFTVRWQDPDINIQPVFVFPFFISPSGPTIFADGYYYQTFMSASPITLNNTIHAGSERLISAFDYTGGNGSCFEIADDEWTNQNNADYYIELWGLDRTGIIYEAFTPYLGELQISCPDDIYTVADNEESAIIDYNVIVIDDVDVDFFYEFSGATTGNGSGTGSGMSFNVGETTVIITASSSCYDPGFCSFSLTVTQPLSGQIISQTNVLCYGEETGEVTVAGAGGSPPYLYSINGGGFQESGNFSELAAGHYMITILDNNSDIWDMYVIIDQPEELSGSVMSTNLSAPGAQDGSISVENISGGSGFFEVSIGSEWLSVAGQSYIFDDLPQGVYTVELRDEEYSGCSIILAEDIIIEYIPEYYSVSFSVEDVDGAYYGSLIATVDGNEITSGDQVEEYSSVEFLAIPDMGYQVGLWSLNGLIIDDFMNEIFIIESLENDISVTVAFEPTEYFVTGIIQPAEAGTVIGTGIYYFGDNVIVEAIANTGYEFINWTDNEGNEVSPEAIYNFSMPASDVTLTANFQMTDYTLTLVASPEEGGNVAGAGVYNFGDEVTISATPNTGWGFINWTNEDGDELFDRHIYHFTMPASDVTLTANFEMIDYTLTLVANPVAGGQVSGAGKYNFGDKVTISATPNTGWEFINWTDEDGSEVSDQASHTFEMPDSNKKLTANFQQSQYPDIPENLHIDNITIESGQTICFNALKTIHIAHNDGYFIVKDNATVTLIAGENIVMKPGTHIHTGANLLAYIAPNGPFCGETEPHFLTSDYENEINIVEEKNISVDVFYSENVKNHFILYPNPAQHSFSIDLNNIEIIGDQPILVKMFNIHGHLIKSEKYSPSKHITISIHDFVSGLYVIKIIQGNYTEFDRLIINN